MNDAIKNENRLTKMEERLKNIEDKLDKLPNEIMAIFKLEIDKAKNEAIRDARDDDNKVFVRKDDHNFFQQKVCEVIELRTGKFLWKSVISQIITSAIVSGLAVLIALKKLL